MLLNLTIQDLAVVKSLNLDLAKGMSVLTGETGAGKSILLTALGLALGDRADAGYVRPDCQRAEVNLEFDLSDAPLAKQWLEEQDLDADGQCLIRRVVSADGRSKAYINGSSVTLQSLQTLSEKLVEIHGQHAHLTLLDVEEQRRLLDVFAKTQPLLDKVNTCYKRWQQAHKELHTLQKASTEKLQREELLRYQLEELQQLDFSHYDYASLSEEHSKQANLELILTTGAMQLEALYEGEHCLHSSFNQSIKELSAAARYAPELNDVVNLLAEAQIQTEEAAVQLRHFLKTQEADPQYLADLEAQITLIQTLSRKHHVSPEHLPELFKQLDTELNALTHSNERIEQLSAETAVLLADYQKLAQQLTEKRQQQGKKLQKQISATIKELGMPHGEFIVEIIPVDADTPKLNGSDNVNFLVSANVGLPAKPLAKVASGGELSRISLAIQVTTASDKSTPTMIFDEVDSGIGGGIAEIVGQKLRHLSHNRQVLCVTHLPQVAAQAHQHLYVEKTNKTDITTSTVRLLTDQQRVSEVARMLGGVTMTANTLAHAQEMLDQVTGVQSL
jgi:DNA repair protein RecN (Recombination protein N)